MNTELLAAEAHDLDDPIAAGISIEQVVPGRACIVLLSQEGEMGNPTSPRS